MMIDQNAQDVERNWMYYLICPLELIKDLPTLTTSQKLAHLKQFLSQAEMTDKKSYAASRNGTTPGPETDSRRNGTEQTVPSESEVDPSLIYSKSKILNALALQVAADLQFNLNLFAITYDIPLRLLARLYRVLLTATSRRCSVLSQWFEQPPERDNIFAVNPYANFPWQKLHPTATYAVMSYHVWCLQVALSCSMLPQPYRNMTPVVSGLTEIPDTVFFADNRVELSVLMERVEESVLQLTSILSNSENLQVAKPLPNAFPVVGPGLPPAIADQNSKLEDYSQILPSPYLVLSLKFVLGRYAFQKHQFEQAEELLQSSLLLMSDRKLEYVPEVGASTELLRTYLKACKSQSQLVCELPVPKLRALQFVELFCTRLASDLKAEQRPDSLFWCSTYTEATELSTPKESTDDTSETDQPTWEDQLIVLLMEDLHSEQDSNIPDSIAPIGVDIRTRLERLCLERLSQECKHVEKITFVSPSKKHARLSKSATTVRGQELLKCRQLYTKVVICNAIFNLMSGFFAVVAHFIILLLTTIPESTTPAIDPIFGTTFLMDSLICLSRALRKDPSQWATSRLHFVSQLLDFWVLKGTCLIGYPNKGDRESLDLKKLRENFHTTLRYLASHELFDSLSPSRQSRVQTLLEDFDHSRPTHKTTTGESKETLESDAFNSHKDVDMRFLSGLTPRGDGIHDDWGPAEPDPSAILTLLSSNTPSDIVPIVRQLLHTVPAARVLELHSAWLPTLHRLFHVGLTTGPSSVQDVENIPFELPLVQDPSAVTIHAAMIMLAKAALLNEQPQSDLIHNSVPRSLLLASLNGLTTFVGSQRSLPVSTSTSNDPIRWMYGAIHHELLLSDLMEVLRPTNEFIVRPSDGTSAALVQKPGSPSRGQLNDLSRRAKACLFHATGLQSAMLEGDQKMLSNQPLGLSVELINAASCFLLANHEPHFLLPTAKQFNYRSLPKGALPLRGHFMGPLELTRALLRLHRAINSLSGATDPKAPDAESTREESTSESTGSGRDPTASVKAAMNNLWNLLILGCLVPELGKNISERHPQISLGTLIRFANTLSLLSRPGSMCRSSEDKPRKVLPYYLLNYLIVCLAHLYQCTTDSFHIPVRNSPKSAINNLPSANDRTPAGGAVESQSAPQQAESTPNASSGPKTSRWDPHPKDGSKDAASSEVDNSLKLSLLGSSLWPTEAPSLTQLSLSGFSDAFCTILSTALSHRPARLDWLQLLAELEFSQKHYQASLCVQLEICAVATNGFTQSPPDCITCQQFCHRMVETCKALGLLTEAFVLCQLGMDGCLINTALQILHRWQIPNPDDSKIHVDPGNVQLFGGQPTTTTEQTGSEQSEGAGLWRSYLLNSLDAYVEYLWDVQLLEALAACAANYGLTALCGKFCACLSLLELNANNPKHILTETAEARALEFLSLMAARFIS